MSSPLRILLLGDLHLGRRPSRLGPALQDAGLDAGRFLPARALEDAAALALQEEVDAVLFAGDVVDTNEDLYGPDSWPVLQRQVERLTAAGIAVAGVAGNHDDLALPRLAERVPGFRLLGRGGRWERWRIEGRDGAAAEVFGWSFPGRHHDRSPLEEALPERDPAVAALGLLHADLVPAGTRSRYAPVQRAELEAAGLDAWFLGHIHQPGELSGPQPLGYLGNVLPLDPGETGARGSWLVEVQGPGQMRAELRPQARLRYETAEARLEGEAAAGTSADELHAFLQDEARRVLDGCAPAPELLVLRLRLVGEAASPRAVQEALAELGESASLLFAEGESLVLVDRVIPDLRPRLDLEALAGGGAADLAGLLARRLLALERGEEDRALLEEAARHLDRLERNSWARQAAERPRDERRLLLAAGRLLLADLLASKSGAAGEGGA